MTVAELIETLKKLPQDLPVYYMDDGWDVEITRVRLSSTMPAYSRYAHLPERVLL